MPVADKPAAAMSADELWGAVTGAPSQLDHRDRHGARAHCIVHGRIEAVFAYMHVSCPADLCPYCASPVTNAQINDGDAFPIDERGPDDQRYAHRECAQEAKSR